MKTTIFHRTLLFATAVLTFAACNTPGDKFDYDYKDFNVAYMSGTDTDPLRKFVVEDTPVSDNVSVMLAAPAEKDVTVKVAIDLSKVEEYNNQNQTSYFPIPENAVELVNDVATIPAGKAFSEAFQVRLNSTEDFEEGRTYLIPVTIVSAGDIDILEAQRTAYLKVARVLEFNALDISNPTMSSNFIFEDSQMVPMSSGFTYEIKFYGNTDNSFHQATSGNPTRLCSFTAKDESNSSMLRFSENDKPESTLQWVCPGGNVVSNAVFTPYRWYLLSLTFDGTNLTMYIDGNKDCETTYTGSEPINFQRIELGMSWESYQAKQIFRGRIAEMRVWNRPLSAGEIKIGACGVDAKSNGLVAYWKFNEGQGYEFHDATGNGYDMNWSKSVRDASGNGTLIPTPEAANAIQWSIDPANNKCAE